MLKLEAGKRYWRRDGGVSGPLTYRGGAEFCFADEIMSWKIDGAWTAGGQSHGDLVREYTEPQPLEWKRGIPTEEECRECWILTGNNGNRPDNRGCVYEPNEIANPSARFAKPVWYLPLRIKPVEPPKPKTRTVTQRKYTTKFGEEMWTDQQVFRASGWIDANETRTVEVPCE